MDVELLDRVLERQRSALVENGRYPMIDAIASVISKQVKGAWTMTDLLVRGVSDETLKTLDEAAARNGLSRNAYVRQLLERESASASRPKVTREDLERSLAAMADLGNEEVMRKAWE